LLALSVWVTAVPHSGQNLLPAGSFTPQLRHDKTAPGAFAPHSEQNLPPSGNSLLQFGQIIITLISITMYKLAI
jgi:hypothetical protein